MSPRDPSPSAEVRPRPSLAQHGLPYGSFGSRVRRSSYGVPRPDLRGPRPHGRGAYGRRSRSASTPRRSCARPGRRRRKRVAQGTRSGIDRFAGYRTEPVGSGGPDHSKDTQIGRGRVRRRQRAAARCPLQPGPFVWGIALGLDGSHLRGRREQQPSSSLEPCLPSLQRRELPGRLGSPPVRGGWAPPRDARPAAARRDTSSGTTRRGALLSPPDADGNATPIERDAAGSPTTIIAPYGQRTTLTVGASGYLASIADPATTCPACATSSRSPLCMDRTQSSASMRSAVRHSGVLWAQNEGMHQGSSYSHRPLWVYLRWVQVYGRGNTPIRLNLPNWHDHAYLR